MILRRYQLKLRMNSVKRENNSRASKANRKKEKEGSSDALISKDKEVLAAEKILNGKRVLIQIWRKGLRTMRRYQLKQ